MTICKKYRLLCFLYKNPDIMPENVRIGLLGMPYVRENNKYDKDYREALEKLNKEMA